LQRLALQLQGADMATSPALLLDIATLVTLSGDAPVTTSLKVAEHFGKRHFHVLRDIQALKSNPDLADFNESNFGFVEYRDDKGEMRPLWQITKDGFVFLAMGYTGAKAAKLKLAYIAAFNKMAAHIEAEAKRHLTALTRGLNPDEPQVMTVNEFATQYLAGPTRGDKIRLGAMAGSLGTLAGRDRSTTQRHGTRCRVHTPQALMRAAMALGLSFK
jgi:Rha family phage regulatory protein